AMPRLHLPRNLPPRPHRWFPQIPPHLPPPAAVYDWETHLRQIHTLLGQSTQEIAFADHERAGHFSPVSYPALRILTAASQQLLIQIGQIANLRHRDKVIATEVATFPFHAALLVSFL